MNKRHWFPFCIECGRRFEARRPGATFCSPRCSRLTFRARTVLEGTHGYVGHQFQRLSK